MKKLKIRRLKKVKEVEEEENEEGEVNEEGDEEELQLNLRQSFLNRILYMTPAQ